MKVIGTAEGGYLVSATEDELAMICGVSFYDAPWRKSDRHRGDQLKPGTIIPVDKMFRRLGELREGERKLKEGAAHLRALATLMETQTPDAILPPEPEFDKAEGSR